jgi:uncharacterized alkaline shock family protein YloU
VAGQSSISPDVLASYAADAARDVDGVLGLVGNALQRHEGVKVGREDGAVTLELHLALSWGASAPAVGAEVQERVAETLERMADLRPAAVAVVVDEFAPPARAR